MEFRPVHECFEISDEIRAQHNLYEDFKQERTDIKKFIFYLWLHENPLNAKYGKDNSGSFGYGLKFIPKKQ
jgi:hypothetical protein